MADLLTEVEDLKRRLWRASYQKKDRIDLKYDKDRRRGWWNSLVDPRRPNEYAALKAEQECLDQMVYELDVILQRARVTAPAQQEALEIVDGLVKFFSHLDSPKWAPKLRAAILGEVSTETEDTQSDNGD